MGKALGIVITDGVGYRNFILSDFIAEAERNFEKVYILSCLPKETYEGFNFNCDVIELEVFQEKFPTWFFRKAKEVAHLQLHAEGNFGIKDNLRATYSKANNFRGFATRFLHKWSKRVHSEQWILRYNRWQQQTFKTNVITQQYKQILKAKEIDMLFFTHQRPPYIAPLVFAAEQLHIKTTAFIFSWDNLASKGRMAGNFDYFMVWSQLMKNELLQFYKSVKENQIEIVGTPQFEPYVLNRYGLTRDEFLTRFGLKAEQKTILFSCGDVSTSPNDPVYIEAIAKGIASGKIAEKVNFLVRTSPAEEPGRFKALSQKYPFIRWNYPDWHLARSGHQENWSQRIPSVQDVSDLKSVLQYTDVSVNMLSTMSLDTMLFDKPVVNTVFGNGSNGLSNDQRFLDYAHIQKVVESDAVALAKNEDDLIASINKCLSFPLYKTEQQKQLIAMQIGKPLEETSKRIAETLRNWC